MLEPCNEALESGGRGEWIEGEGARTGAGTELLNTILGTCGAAPGTDNEEDDGEGGLDGDSEPLGNVAESESCEDAAEETPLGVWREVRDGDGE